MNEESIDRYKIDNEKRKLMKKKISENLYNRYLTIRDWNLKTIPF